MKSNYIYHFITGALFLLLAMGLYLIPSLGNGFPAKWRNILIAVMLLWGFFRLYHAYSIKKRQNREE